MLNSLDSAQWGLVLLGAYLVGLGKGGLPGIGNLTVAIFALVFPSKLSAGILLPVLICADMAAVIIYRKHAEWRYMARLMPSTLIGIVIGSMLLGNISDQIVSIMIGSILISMTGLHFYRKYRLQFQNTENTSSFFQSYTFVATTGIAGGFATMVANAAGPVASMYLLAVGLPKYAFIGTAAWFFMIINWIKVPFQIYLGNISSNTLGLSLTLGIPAVLGAITAPFIVKHIQQKLFEKIIWFFIVLAGIRLLWDAF
ncbi:MAG: sulfite exporter TauE/SafE family protein [Verrucomicrobiota bacterium]